MADKKLNVGVIGLGMMGRTHLDVYGKRSDVNVLAVSDILPDRLHGKTKAAGNIEGQAATDFKMDDTRKYDEGMKLIADPDVQLVDICLPTPLHVEYAIAALQAGKHVLSEKPVGLTSAQAQELAAAASKSPQMLMIAMCMRFWPGWTWLKDAVQNKTYGKVLAATFRRMSSHPGGPFYLDASKCGGAILDLHIHDTDFIFYTFGMPKAVCSVGYSKPTGGIDHVVTQYKYDDIPVVVAEGGWAMSDGYGFKMQYTVNFEKATAVFDLAAKDPLMLYEPGKAGQAVALQPGMGYEYEIDYLVNCIAKGEKPKTVTVSDTVAALKIIEAEIKSVKTGQVVSLG